MWQSEHRDLSNLLFLNMAGNAISGQTFMAQVATRVCIHSFKSIKKKQVQLLVSFQNMQLALLLTLCLSSNNLGFPHF